MEPLHQQFLAWNRSKTIPLARLQAEPALKPFLEPARETLICFHSYLPNFPPLSIYNYNNMLLLTDAALSEWSVLYACVVRDTIIMMASSHAVHRIHHIPAAAQAKKTNGRRVHVMHSCIHARTHARTGLLLVATTKCCCRHATF
jgi:hypothetical protein